MDITQCQEKPCDLYDIRNEITFNKSPKKHPCLRF